MAGPTHSVGCRALVEPPVTGVKTGDVEVADDVSTGAKVLAYHQPAAEKCSDQPEVGCGETKRLRLGKGESDHDIDIDSSLIKGGSIID